MQKNLNNITHMTDLLEEVAMLYYNGTCDEERENSDVFNYDKQKLHSNFYESLLTVVDYYIGESDKLPNITEEVAKQIDDKLDELTTFVNTEKLSREDIRRALLLIDIKGFKNLNFSLDIITPDSLCVLMDDLIKTLTSDLDEITIFDPCMGVGNSLFYTASNTEKDLKLIGMDSHQLMARVSAMKANLLQVDLEMHFEDALSFVPRDIDVVYSDLPSYDYENANLRSSLYDEGARYFPYLLIDHLLNIPNKTTYVFLIDNDFFNHEYADSFRQRLLKKANILALIALPLSFFSKPIYQKSILILDNDMTKMVTSTNVFTLPPLEEKEKFLNVLKQIKSYLAN